MKIIARQDSFSYENFFWRFCTAKQTTPCLLCYQNNDRVLEEIIALSTAYYACQQRRGKF